MAWTWAERLIVGDFETLAIDRGEALRKRSRRTAKHALRVGEGEMSAMLDVEN